MLKFIADFHFEVPDGTTSEELAELLDYIGRSVKDHPRILTAYVPSFRPAGPISCNSYECKTPASYLSSFPGKDGIPLDVNRAHCLHHMLELRRLCPQVVIQELRQVLSTPAPSVARDAPTPPKLIRVLIQKWEESERGWGTRPDGYSIHPSEEARSSYVKAYNDALPAEAPDEYERPSGAPYWVEMDVTPFIDGVVVKELGTCIRVYRHHSNYGGYPGHGGTDGWMNIGEKPRPVG